MGGPLGLVHVTTLNVAARGASRVLVGWAPPEKKGGPPRFVSALARLSAPSLLSPLPLLACVLVLFPVGWLCAAAGCRPVFFDSLCACYAKRRILCARLGEWVCASLVAGRVSVSLVFFFEEATMPGRGGASGA